MGFLPANFLFAVPFQTRLNVRRGTADRQTDRDGRTDDGRQCMMPSPYDGRGITKLNGSFNSILLLIRTEST